MSSTQNLTRQQVYDRIKQSSREEFILDEMIRLGFWEKNVDQPSIPDQLIRREGALNREIQSLSKDQKLLQNPEKVLSKIRKERMAEARKRRKETREKREAERIAKAKAWQLRQKTDICYLGEDVSAGLNNKESLIDRLKKQGLPQLTDAASLAKAMNISIGELRFLAFNRKVSEMNHYRRFMLPKKAGGQRLISAPMPRLKEAQYWILGHILYPIPLHKATHGFRPDHSIVSNARPHIGQDVVINLDLKDFFPTVSYPRVKGLFKAIGYSEQIATILGLICTESDVVEVELDGKKYYVTQGERHLPQGSPCSPMITNLLCRKLDARLQGIADKKGFSYTRYADDLTFSASGDNIRNMSQLIWQIGKVVEDEGFILHPEKLRIMRKGRKQEVTGIVVNEKLSVDRKTLRKFRALLFQIEKDGIEGKYWPGKGSLLSSIRGYANFVFMVDPEKGRPLKLRVEKILSENNYRHVIRHKPKPKSRMNPSTQSEGKPWWKFW